MSSMDDTARSMVLAEPTPRSLSVSRPGLPPRAMARLAAAIYLVSGVPAGFSVWVLAKLVAHKDAATAATSIMASQGLYRLGFVADLVGIVMVLASFVLVYELFEPVSRPLARMAMYCGIVGSGLQALDSLADSAALIALKGATVAAFTPAQVQALALLFARLHGIAYDIALVFFGSGFIALGLAVRRASFMPRIIGVPLIIDGLGYIGFAFSVFLSPPLAARFYPVLPFATALLGEGALMFWLLVRGVDDRRWAMQAAAARTSSAGEIGAAS